MSDLEEIQELVKSVVDEPIVDPAPIEVETGDIRKDVTEAIDEEPDIPAQDGQETITEEELDKRTDFPRRPSSISAVRPDLSTLGSPEVAPERPTARPKRTRIEPLKEDQQEIKDEGEPSQVSARPPRPERPKRAQTKGEPAGDLKSLPKDHMEPLNESPEQESELTTSLKSSTQPEPVKKSAEPLKEPTIEYPLEADSEHADPVKGSASVSESSKESAARPPRPSRPTRPNRSQTPVKDDLKPTDEAVSTEARRTLESVNQEFEGYTHVDPEDVKNTSASLSESSEAKSREPKEDVPYEEKLEQHHDRLKDDTPAPDFPEYVEPVNVNDLHKQLGSSQESKDAENVKDVKDPEDIKETLTVKAEPVVDPVESSSEAALGIIDKAIAKEHTDPKIDALESNVAPEPQEYEFDFKVSKEPKEPKEPVKTGPIDSTDLKESKIDASNANDVKPTSEPTSEQAKEPKELGTPSDEPESDASEKPKPVPKPKPSRPANRPSVMSKFPIDVKTDTEKAEKPRPKPKLGSRIAAMQGTAMFNDLSAAIAKGPRGPTRRTSLPEPDEESEELKAEEQIESMPKDPRARTKGPKRRLPAAAKPSYSTVVAELWSFKVPEVERHTEPSAEKEPAPQRSDKDRYEYDAAPKESEPESLVNPKTEPDVAKVLKSAPCKETAGDVQSSDTTAAAVPKEISQTTKELPDNDTEVAPETVPKPVSKGTSVGKDLESHIKPLDKAELSAVVEDETLKNPPVQRKQRTSSNIVRENILDRVSKDPHVPFSSEKPARPRANSNIVAENLLDKVRPDSVPQQAIEENED